MFISKSILVTGGAGFLGSHLCRRLLADGHQVLCLDNYFTGQKKNIEKLLSNPNFKSIDHDISEPYFEKVDEIYNLACPASPIHYQKDRIQTMTTSVIGAMNLLRLAKEQNCRIFQASTSEVYGDPEQHPQQESYWGNVNPIGPRACYDEGKRCAETLFFDYQREYNLEIKVARIFNTYGPNMHPLDGRVVSNFITQALKGEPITIYGDGTQTRSFCYVDDLIEGFVRLMNSARDVSGPFNLGNPAEFTVRELATKIIEMTGSRSKIIYLDLPMDDPTRRRPDISKAKAALNWQPEVPLEMGLRMTIDYFEQELSSTANIEKFNPQLAEAGPAITVSN